MPAYPTYKLSEIARSTKGKKPKSVSKEKTDGFEIPYVDIKAFEKGIVDNYTDGENCTFCKPDEVLIVWDGARCGFVGRGVEGAIGSTLAKISSDKYTNDFLFYFLQSKYKVLNSNPRGVGIPHIEPNLLWNFEIPDVDKTTQHLIVSRIETLFAELDKAAEHLRTAQQQLKTYRQAVLNHWLNNDGGKWEMVKLGEVAEIKGGKRLPKGHYYSEKPTEYRYIMAGNLKNNTVSLDTNFIEKATYEVLKHYEVIGGEVYITIVGACIGDVGIIPANLGCSILTENAAKIVNINNLTPDFLTIVLRSSCAKTQIKSKILSATLGKLALSRIAEIVVPLPPLAEQQRIVKEIESRLSQATASETYIENALQQAEALRQSILKKAFSGELV